MFKFLLSFFSLKEMDSIYQKAKPNAIKSVNNVYPVETFAWIAPTMNSCSHHLFFAKRKKRPL